jgi:cell wall-associated NlpC family hydrolase
LHLEVIKNAVYLNPSYFVYTGSYSLSPIYGDPGMPMGDGSYAALIAAAEAELGKPYIYGASGPDAYDCSGFVSAVLNNSGVKYVGRLGATGLYNICTPISPEDAMPGDLITFAGTYSTSSPISHIGIYVGEVNNRKIMVHAGHPVQYTYIDTEYWKEHFYSFCRVNP